ncbi:MAG: hypothetical protein WC332_00890 [Clostridia bacterium]|jgi:hypothetical protein
MASYAPGELEAYNQRARAAGYKDLASQQEAEKVARGDYGVEAQSMGYEEWKKSTDTFNNGSPYSNITMPSVPTIPEYTPSVTYTAPTYVAPEKYVAPTYNAPTYDEGKVESLAQKKAAPGLRAARMALQQTTGGYYENPNVKRMTLRDALAGYGLGVENVIAGASGEARNQYNTEYGIEADASKTTFNAGVEGGKLNYNTELIKSQQEYAGKTSEAEKNYTAQLEADKTNYQANLTTKMAEYQAQLSDYMAKMYGTGATKYGAVSSSIDNPVSKYYSGKPYTGGLTQLNTGSGTSY